ncbi:hypothetical protein [Salinispora arenicola]|uniref:hypothetical protein n=1 Tax=Salinispora arenicola TaxID=168697 RepID=UPI0016A286D2|nr:hypothetical protein [Salinispora arenicola]NIL64901.1 hypothetical protein [Salinispora arenicola]
MDREPDRTAISFSGAAAPAGHGGSLDLTNAQLYSRVGRIAPLLRRDTRVLVLLPAGPDFFAALFARSTPGRPLFRPRHGQRLRPLRVCRRGLHCRRDRHDRP